MTRALVALGLVGTGACSGTGRWTLGGRVETPAYQRVSDVDGVELRQYGSMVVAETETDGGMSGKGGFGKLAGYIFGGNDREQSIAMTAPVAQQEVKGDNGSRWVMTFSMPSEHAMESLPTPRDSNVRLKRVPAQLMAVHSFRGLWDNDDVRGRAEELERRASRQGLRAIGPPVFARYDPPWTPPFMRRNEVMLPVARVP